MKLRLITGVLFFAKQTKPQSVRALLSGTGVLFFAKQTKPQSVRALLSGSGVLFFAKQIFFWGVTRKGSGYPLQVLALPSSGCGLFTSILHATYQTPKHSFYLMNFTKIFAHFTVKSLFLQKLQHNNEQHTNCPICTSSRFCQLAARHRND
ncbi:hypothetical protein FI146_60099 [Flavobacterium psychrophilum]|nr:hypothetical protein FI146_60099 [Flavobacterium psychrophilum]